MEIREGIYDEIKYFMLTKCFVTYYIYIYEVEVENVRWNIIKETIGTVGKYIPKYV